MEPLLLAFVAGLFSLLGAFAGAGLARRTEYEKWLRQNRAEAFGQLMQRLSESLIEHVAAKSERSLAQLRVLERSPETDKLIAEMELSGRLLRPTAAVEEYVRVVRFYLPKKQRGELLSLIREFRAMREAENFDEMEKSLERIQHLLETAIDG